VIVALVFVADWLHLVPISKTPILLALGWISLRLRRTGWRAVGLARFRSWPITLLIGTAAGLGMEILQLFGEGPLLAKLTGRPADLSIFRPLIGNAELALLGLALAWTLAAMGEELVYRGYLMNRVADVGGRRRQAWVLSLIVVSIVFALAHTYQGLTGVVEAGIDGLILGILYLRCDRRLSVPIVAHGVQDTVDLLLIYLGRYPGM
jgi:hypothetical protein